MASPDDHLLAQDLAAGAGRLLVELRSRLVAEGAEARTLKDTGDRDAHRFLLDRLSDARPSDSVLSEEGADDSARLDASRVWIVDPLDGTREFSEPPRSDWAVHVALVEDGVPTAGAVALPALGLTYSTLAPPALPEPREPPRIVVSRTRPPAVALGLATSLGGDLVEMGSAGAKTMALLRGMADIYPHAGGQYEWDSCAPVAVAAAAGLHCSRIDGTPLLYNRANPYLPDLLVCHQRQAHVVLDLIQRLQDNPSAPQG